MLTDAQIKSAKSQQKPYKLTDSRGLFLLVKPTGFKSWRWKFQMHGKEKLLTLGAYPEVSLADARERRDELLKQKRSGLDPAVARRQEQAARASAAAHTFKAIAEQWHAMKSRTLSSRHSEQVLKSLKAEVFPLLGDLPIKSITGPLVLQVLRPIIERGAVDQAHRVRQRMSDVFVFAMASDLADLDPAAMVKKALPPVVKRNYPALRTIEGAQALLVAAEAAPAFPLTKLASRLMALTAVRSEPLRYAEPHEFEDLSTRSAIWRIPASKMKLGVPSGSRKPSSSLCLWRRRAWKS